MKLLLDLQAIQGAARYRGLGRYSLEFAAAVARRADVEHVTVLLNGGLGAQSLVEDRQLLAERLPNAEVVVFDAPWPWAAGDWRQLEAQRRAEAVRDACIRARDPDAVIVCSLFSWANQAVVSVPAEHRPLTAVIAYDFLPLTDEDSRLSDEDRPWFMDRMQSLANADLLLSISDFTSGVVREILGDACPPCVTIWGSSFTLPDVAADEPRRGIVVAGGDGRRKNEASTIRAFAELPKAVRQAHPLTVVGRQTHPDLLPHKVAAEVGLDESEYLVLGREISDEELARIYASARVVVMPSRGEGLGMPVLEAWRYGTPAVMSNVTSLPELVADDRYTFPPDDASAQAAVLLPLLTDDEAWQGAVEHAASRSHLFTWERAAAVAVDRIAAALGGRQAQGRQVPGPPLALVSAVHARTAADRALEQGLGRRFDVSRMSAREIVDRSAGAASGRGRTVGPLAAGSDRALFDVRDPSVDRQVAAAALQSGRGTVLVSSEDLGSAFGAPDEAGAAILRYAEGGLAALLNRDAPLGTGLLRRADAVAVLTPELRDRLTRHDGTGIPPERVSLVSHDGGASIDPDLLAEAIERGHRCGADGATLDPEQARAARRNRPMRTGGTLYVDVTSVVESDRRTGIERVSVALCRALAEQYSGRVFPVRQRGGSFHHDLSALDLLLGHTGLAQVPVDPEVRFLPGDLVLCPENKRDLPVWSDAINNARGRGAAYVQIVHDLLPVLLEDFFPPFVKPWYREWLEFVEATADIVLCNSQATLSDFLGWLADDDARGLASRSHWLRLASTMGNSSIVTPDLRLRPRGRRRVLAVGTIEPRKAYDLLLDAVEELCHRGEDVELVVVGRPGWVRPELLDRLAAARSPGRLTWLDDASDLDLQWEYLNADLLVMASRAEGFGLPIVEAVAHGVPVLARDVPVFREILGPDGQYFVLDRDLPDAILAALRNDAPPACLPDRLVDWGETADDLLRAVRGEDGNFIGPLYRRSRRSRGAGDDPA